MCAEKCMFGLHVVAVSKSIFVIRSNGMLLSLLEQAAPSCTIHHAPAYIHVGFLACHISKGASRAASGCNGCLKMHLPMCMRAWLYCVRCQNFMWELHGVCCE